jgi:hypothetical protein
MPNLSLDSLWPGLIAWIILYISDYTLTIVCARMYQAGVKNKIVIEGSYELTPYYQADVDALRRVSPRFLAMLVFGCVAIVTIWYASQNADCSRSLYAFVVGSMILVELAVHVRHLRNYYTFRSVLHSGDAIRGRIEYSRRLTFLLSSVEILAFARAVSRRRYRDTELVCAGRRCGMRNPGLEALALGTKGRCSPRRESGQVLKNQFSICRGGRIQLRQRKEVISQRPAPLPFTFDSKSSGRAGTCRGWCSRERTSPNRAPSPSDLLPADAESCGSGHIGG